MGITSSTGLASGMNYDSLISGLLSIERQPLSTIQKTQSLFTDAKNLLTGISNKLSTLKTAADALNTTSGWASAAVSSSDSTIAVAGVAGGTTSAVAGNYSVIVDLLAREYRSNSSTRPSSTDAMGQSGTLSITINGTSKSITIGADDSMATIAANINGSGARVNASVLYDGSNYRIQMRGLDQGAANAVTLAQTGSVALGFAETQAARDASIRVDGVTITRSNNQVTDAIPGITLALVKESVTAVNVKVSNDASALTTKIQTFVNSYNDVIRESQRLMGSGTVKAANSALAGDGTLRSIQTSLASIQGGAVSGTSGAYTSLASIGLASTRDGTLTFDTAKFSTALSTDSLSVSKLFVTDAALGATGVMSRFKTQIDAYNSTTTSSINARIDTFDKRNKRLTDDATSLTSRIALYETQLRKRFAALESTLSNYQTQAGSLSSLFSSSG